MEILSISALMYKEEPMTKNLLISKVFLWMSLGLFISFVTGLIVSLNENMLLSLIDPLFYWIVPLSQIILVVILTAFIEKMKPITAEFWFLLYSFTSGLTISSLFLIFNVSTMIYAFLTSAIVFALFAAIGSSTKMNLSKHESILSMGLLALVICFIVGFSFANSTFELIMNFVTVILFIGFTAHDMQKILKLRNSKLPKDNLAIYGALELYLDFVNIFLSMVHLMDLDQN